MAPALEPSTDWTAAALAELVTHIQQRYHRRLREDLPRLDAAFRHEMTRRPAADAVALAALYPIFSGLMGEMLDHMAKEDGVLFPAIVEAERSAPQGAAPAFGWVVQPIAVMVAEHASAVEALDALRHQSEGFVAPPGAAQAVCDLYQGLAAIDADLKVHIHLENDILFPRAAALVD